MSAQPGLCVEQLGAYAVLVKLEGHELIQQALELRKSRPVGRHLSSDGKLIVDAVRAAKKIKLARLQERLKDDMNGTKVSILAADLVNREVLISTDEGYTYAGDEQTAAA